jgi:hypothetical protein
MEVLCKFSQRGSLESLSGAKVHWESEQMKVAKDGAYWVVPEPDCRHGKENCEMLFPEVGNTFSFFCRNADNGTIKFKVH